MIKLNERLLKGFDWTLFFSIVIIPLLGLTVLYSAGYDPESSAEIPYLPNWFQSPTALKQLIFLTAGSVMMLVLASLPPIWFFRSAYIFYALSICLLVMVDQMGIIVKGSQRWFALGPIRLQPSEISKLAIVLVMARYISTHPPKSGSYTMLELFRPALLLAVPTALIMKQPDLGTSLSVAGIGAMMIVFVGVKLKTALLGAALGISGAAYMWNHLHDYQRRRVLTMIDPNTDPLGSGYQTIQSAIAVGSGGLTGKGFLRGTQTQLEFLPEHTTDFVFSVLNEEWGFVGGTAVILLFCHLIYRLLTAATRSKQLFGTMVAVGMASHIFFHMLINISMVLGLAPVVGIPLPLFSYGGSSLLFTLLGLGIALGSCKRSRGF